MSDYDDQERYEANDTATQEEDESLSSSGVDADYPPSTNHLDFGDGENDLLSASISYRETLMENAQQQTDFFVGTKRHNQVNDDITNNQRHDNDMVESYLSTHSKMMLETDGSNESLAQLISSYDNRMEDDAMMGGTVTTASDINPGEAFQSIITSPPSTIPAITTPGTVTRVRINDASTSRVASLSSNNADHLGMSLFSPLRDLQPRTTNTNEEQIGGLPSSDEQLFIPPLDGGTTSTEGAAATASGTNNAIDGTDSSTDGMNSTMVTDGAITAIGAIVSKVCVANGKKYQGCIIAYDVKRRLYLIQYNANRPDCDKEELNEAQVAKYKIRDYSSTDTDNSDDEDEDDEHEYDEDEDEDEVDDDVDHTEDDIDDDDSDDDDSPSDDDDDDRLTQNHRLSGCQTTKSMSESSYIDSSSDNS